MLVDLAYKVASVPQSQSIYTGVRKIVQGLTHSITDFPPVDLNQLGYRGVGDGKIRQLLRNYWNEAEVEAAKIKLKARRSSPHTSIALNTLGERKDCRSQGACVRALVITQTAKVTEIDVLYRSTEVLQKFTADLVMLPRMLNSLELAHKPRIIRFYFANSFLTALFAPVLFQHTDAIEFYEHLKVSDPKYYRTFLNATAKFYEPINRYSYKHRVRMWEIAQAKLDCKKLAQYCLDNGASFRPGDLMDEDTDGD